MFLVGRRVFLPGGEGLKFILLGLLVLVPSLVAMLFYTLQDRLEPEPVSHVVYAFLAGVAAAALGAIPLWHSVFRIREWLYASSSLFIAGAFLVLAPVASLLIYAVLRYGFFPLREFDEPVDGMVYGAVIGVGMAFTVSFHHLVSRPDCTLFVITHVAATHILVYSAVGALIALLLGTLLLGVYHMINDFIFVSGFEGAFWLSFALTLTYALLVLLYSALMMRRLASQGGEQGLYSCPRFDYLTALFAVALLLSAGVVAGQGLKGTKYLSRDPAVSFYYPYALSQLSFGAPVGPGRLLVGRMKTLFSREGGSDLPVYVALLMYVPPSGEGLPELMQFVETMETESMTVEDTRIGGKKAKRLSYSFVQDAEEADDPFPRLIQVYTDLVPLEGRFLIFVYRASAEHFSWGLPLYEQMLRSVRWDTPAR